VRIESFPRVTTALSDEEKQGISQIARYVELWGCPSNLLYLAEPDYQKPESLKIHRFRDFQIKHLDDRLETFKVSEQVHYVQEVVSDLCKEGSKLIVINAYPDLSGGNLLLWYLLANIAAVKASNAFEHRKLGVTIAGNVKLQDAYYNHSSIMVIGPAIDEFGPERTVNLMETVHRFQAIHRILLLSTNDVTDFLSRIRVAPSEVSRFFYVSSKNPEVGKKGKRRPKNEAQAI